MRGNPRSIPARSKNIFFYFARQFSASSHNIQAASTPCLVQSLNKYLGQSIFKDVEARALSKNKDFEQCAKNETDLYLGENMMSLLSISLIYIQLSTVCNIA